MDLNQRTLMTILVVGCLLSAVFSPHILATLISVVPLLVIVYLFFRLRNPIFLTVFLALVFQWVQINIKIVYGNIFSIPLESQFSFHQDESFLHLAHRLSNLGLICFAVGLYLPLRKRYANFDITEEIDEQYDPRKILINYIVFSIGISFLFLIRNSIPGINTIVVAVSKLKWGLLLLAFIYTHVYDKSRRLLYLVILVEIFLGFTGYFSAFKDIILVVIISLLSLQHRVNTKAVIKFSFIFTVVLLFGLIWSAIKFEYREYLSGGTETQKVVVSKTDAIGEFVNQVSTVSMDEINVASELLLDRVSYIEFFSIVLRNVPDYMPHEGGSIIKEATLFYFKPRLFFPDKPVIDDSDHTNKYTNLDLVDDGQASHSIGFMTDAYIDFGPYGMMVLLFLLGFVFGWIINFIMSKSPNVFWGIIFIVPFYFLLSVYSFNMMKVLGNAITYVIPILLLRKLLYKFFNSAFINE